MATVIAAIVSGLVAIVVATLGARWESARRTVELRKRIDSEAADRREAIASEAVERKHQVDLQEQRLKTELRTEFMAESAINHMLRTADPKRTFASIRDRVGGFDDDELRRLLVRSGALRYKRNADGAELWGLRERNEP